MAGSGGVIVMDETTCMIEALHSAVTFFAHDPAGSARPAANGPGGSARIMRRITEGEGRLTSLEFLKLKSICT
jgi:NADH-quinone oxidoreductase subunit F